MSEEQPEQPRYVTQDQHRADVAELRGELKEEVAGIRQDVAVLTKTVEHLAHTVTTGFSDMRREMDLRHQELSREMDIRHQELSREMDSRHQELIRDMGVMRQDIRSLNTSVQRQMWALIAVVAGGAIKMLFFP